MFRMVKKEHPPIPREPGFSQNDDSRANGVSRVEVIWMSTVAFLLGVIVVLAVMLFWPKSTPGSGEPQGTASGFYSAEPSPTELQQGPATAGLALDVEKDYGDKYSDGILPVGDGRFVTEGAKQGYIYACSQYARNLQTDNGGANVRGPWFSADGTTYDIKKKVSVQGSVNWDGEYTVSVNGNKRTIVSNDLPIDHTTGNFPIQNNDPAHKYDRNPNSIKEQSLTYVLSANPVYSDTPNCIGGQVGVMNTGVALFSAFDAGGRDAGAWETQDNCQGHPQEKGEYHYHTLSSCIKDTSVGTVIGFALDGFPITGPKVGTGNILTTADLDECHGIVSEVLLDGKPVTTYHYVMTEDFPYSVSCYRSAPSQPPGQGR